MGSAWLEARSSRLRIQPADKSRDAGAASGSRGGRKRARSDRAAVGTALRSRVGHGEGLEQLHTRCDPQSHRVNPRGGVRPLTSGLWPSPTLQDAIVQGVLDLANDTSAAIQAVMDAGFRRMSPAARVLRALGLSEASDRFALAKLRTDHPAASHDELRLRLALRTLPAELARILAERQGRPELVDELR